MTRIFRALVVLLVSLAGAFTLTPASYADRMVHRDARHDVMRLTQNDDLVPAPHVRDPDVLRVKVAHRQHRLSIVLHFAALRHHRSRLHIATIRTDHGRFYELDAQTSASGRDRVQLTGFGNEDGPIACPRIRYRVGFRRDVVRASVPRRCLETPRWMKVGTGVIRVDRSRGDETLFADDALRRGIRGELAMTRKLYRS